MKYLCDNCLQVYTEEYSSIESMWNDHTFSSTRPCVKSDCSGDVLEIDEIILPTIRELLSKNYYTRFCCSGHYEESSSIYISFSNYDDLYDLMVEMELPKGFVIEEPRNEMFCVRYNFKESISENAKFKLILKKNSELLDWAIKLPDYEGD